MKSFQFPLQKALEWRRQQLDAAEAGFHKQVEALALIDRLAAELKSSERSQGAAVQASRPLTGDSLAFLNSYHRHVLAQQRVLADRRTECAARVAEAQAAMLEARRHARLLEKLREKRLGEWQAAGAHELEELASDSYLAQWNRRRA
jgi:hypothetical protein